MKNLLIFLFSLLAVGLEAAVITNWGAQLPTAVPASGDVILMQQGGVTKYFTPSQLATFISTNASMGISNQIANLNGIGTNTTFYTAINLAANALPMTSNSVEFGSFLAPAKSNWVNNYVAKDNYIVTGPTNLTKVRIGTQAIPTAPGRDVNAFGGFVEVQDGAGEHWARFQHYQYGIAIRSDARIMEIMLNDAGNEIPTLAVTANGNSNGISGNVYGSRLALRDKNDLSGWDMDAHLMWTNGVTQLITSGTDMPGCWIRIGNDFSSGAIQLWTGRAGVDYAARFTVVSNGYVGIGITNPAAKLHLVRGDLAWSGGGDENALWISGTANVNKRLMMTYDTVGNYGIVQSMEAGNDFKPLNLNPSGGNVGVGTLNPLGLFHVAGGIVQTNGGIWQHWSLGAPSAPAANTRGAVLWNDGTNLCAVFRNAGGALATNKLSMAAWP